MKIISTLIGLFSLLAIPITSMAMSTPDGDGYAPFMIEKTFKQQQAVASATEKVPIGIQKVAYDQASLQAKWSTTDQSVPDTTQARPPTGRWRQLAGIERIFGTAGLEHQYDAATVTVPVPS